MTNEAFRASDYVRIEVNEDEVLLQTREEVGRGKRFGTSGEVTMEPEEAERAAKWILARSLDQITLNREVEARGEAAKRRGRVQRGVSAASSR